ncbi:MAG: 50S ribosomal protein L28 [Rickettsiales bacterium]|jgi:large subunit ribosomal protein L28|nr:50S ribosomal protein L28 [Rickettsiales bacterium]
MPRICSILGRTAQNGNKVSHSEVKTKRRFLPNLQTVSFFSDALGRQVQLCVSARGQKTVEKNGGIDAFLTSAGNSRLTPEGRKLKARIAAASLK